MVDRERGYVPTEEGVEIFYEFFKSPGARETILCINGMFQSLFNWYPLKEHLSPGYNILLFDLRGQGKTRIAPDTPVSLDLHVTDMEALLQHLSLKKISIAGMSYGGYVSLIFVANHPELVNRLILLGVGDGYRLEMIIDDWSNMVSLLGDFAFLKFILPSLFSARFIEQNRDDMDRILDALIERNNTENILKMLASITPHPSLPELILHISPPVLHIVGGEDALVAPSKVQKMMEQIKRKGKDKIVIIPGAGHSLIDEVPKEVAFHIRQFLQK